MNNTTIIVLVVAVAAVGLFMLSKSRTQIAPPQYTPTASAQSVPGGSNWTNTVEHLIDTGLSIYNEHRNDY